MAQQPPAPALHKSGSQKKPNAGLKWDEHNLETNERIKAELPPVKINEPKTPYHPPIEGDASTLDPLMLDEPLAGQHHHANDGEGKGADFESARRRHYMKEALAASRKMIEEELKEGE